MWLAGCAVLVALLGGAGYRWLGRPAPAATGDPPADQRIEHTVAVLPFRNLSPDPADAFIGPGIAEAVLNRLSLVHGLTVTARQSAAAFDAATANLREAGEQLHAGYLVVGSAQKSGDRVRVSVRLVDSRSDRQIWSEQFDRTTGELFELQDRIALRIATALEARMANLDPARPSGERSSNGAAYLAYLHGRTLVGRFTIAEAESAAAEFERATQLDPGFSAAYAALYDARLQAASLRRRPLADVRQANQPLLDRALQLNPDSGSALLAKALWVDQDPEQIDADFLRGVELDPSNSRGLTAYSEFLDQHGRRAEAKTMLDRALWVDPLEPRARFRYAQRNFPVVGAAIEQQLQKVMELDPLFYPALQRAAKYRWMQHGDIAQAVAYIERAIAADPQNPWGRHTAAAFYVDLDDLPAARDVVSQDPVALASTRALLASYAGDWRAAGDAALSDGAWVFNDAERWGVSAALRDYALRTHQYRRIAEVIARRYGLPLQGDWKITVFNFREAEQLAHLLLAQGQRKAALHHLGEVIQWIDANARFGPVYNLRTKAQAMMLMGRTDDALALLRESFVQLDFT